MKTINYYTHIITISSTLKQALLLLDPVDSPSTPGDLHLTESAQLAQHWSSAPKGTPFPLLHSDHLHTKLKKPPKTAASVNRPVTS